jgi:hypothetical protein
MNHATTTHNATEGRAQTITIARRLAHNAQRYDATRAQVSDAFGMLALSTLCAGIALACASIIATKDAQTFAGGDTGKSVVALLVGALVMLCVGVTIMYAREMVRAMRDMKNARREYRRTLADAHALTTRTL